MARSQRRRPAPPTTPPRDTLIPERARAFSTPSTRSVPRSEPIRLSLGPGWTEDSLTLLSRLLAPHQDPEAPARTAPLSRVLQPGVRRTAATRAKPTLRSLLRPVFSANTARKLGVCVRRTQRRQVLFAKRQAGYSGSAPGRYRRNPNSEVSCR